jgi:hypothetical protein
MRSTSCGYENPDGMEFLQPLSSVAITAPLPVCPQAASTDSPWHLAATLSTFPSGLEGQRTRISVDPGVMEKRG